MDHALVKSLRASVADGLRAERRTRAESGRPLSSEDSRALGHALTLQALREHRLDELNDGAAPVAASEEDAEIAAAVSALLFGLGRLQPLLDDEAVTNIEINGCDRVWLSLDDGRVVAGPPVADSDAELVELIRTAAAYGGLSSRPFDPANPWLEMRLPDGSRLCALMSVVDRPTVSLRCYRMRRVRLTDLLERGGMSRQAGAFLRACVLGRMNLMISGETFAGKTTLLRALGNEIPAEERLITAEHFLELGFQHYPDLHRDVVAMEERLPNAEGVGALTLTDLVERSRRMNPDRIIVGEVIGGEIVAMLDAMTQGNDGSLSTIHARSAEMVVHRISTYAITSAQRVPVEASHLLTAGALDFVVHVAKRRLADGRLHRYISSIREIVGYDGLQVVSSEVFAAGATGEALPAASITERRVGVLEESGYSPGAWAMAGVLAVSLNALPVCAQSSRLERRASDRLLRMTTDLRLAVAMLAGAGVGTGLVLLLVALRGRDEPTGLPRRRHSQRQALIGLTVGVIVLVATRWVAVAVGLAVLAASWSQLFGAGRSARRGIERLDALATWTESLRDMVATGAALPEALPASAVAVGQAIRPQVDTLVDRLHNREPLTDSLLRFADDLADPGADLVVAALVLNVRAQGRRLRAVLTALARSSRSELEARRRIEADRRAVRRGVQVVVLVTVVMALGLLLLNPSYVAPYRETTGQLVLGAVVGIFAVGFAWLRRLAEFRPPGRFLQLATPSGGRPGIQAIRP